MINSAEDLARAEERQALLELNIRAALESTRRQYTAALGILQERLGLDPQAVLALIAERIHSAEEQCP